MAPTIEAVSLFEFCLK